MINLRLLTLATCVAMLMGMGMMSCSNNNDEENASIVNVEKQVAPSMATPEAAGITKENDEQPVGIIGANPVPEETVEQAEAPVQATQAPAQAETEIREAAVE